MLHDYGVFLREKLMPHLVTLHPVLEPGTLVEGAQRLLAGGDQLLVIALPCIHFPVSLQEIANCKHMFMASVCLWKK